MGVRFLTLPTFVLLMMVAGSSLASPVASQIYAAQGEIERAVRVAGADDVLDAKERQFIRAFVAVLIGVKQRNVAMYVTAALKMRPDLSKDIVTAALQARARNEDGIGYSCKAVSEIVSAAVLAQPQQATVILRAAIALHPTVRQCALAAAIAAAPDQQVALEKTVEANSVSFALLSFTSIHGPTFTFPLDTINPANVSDLREADVNSPEQPPTN